MPLQQPDLGVLRKAQRGDERAFTLIVRTYETPVYNYVLRLVNDRALAEDLTQEVFLRVFQGLPKFSLRSKFTTWLFQVTKNRVLDELRASERRPRHLVALEDVPPLEVVDAPFERVEAVDAVWRSVGELNVDLKMALLLRDIVGLSYTEIADSLEITLATVKWRIYKAREEVQLALAREGITFGEDEETVAASERVAKRRGLVARRAPPASHAPRALPASARCRTARGGNAPCPVEVELEPGRPRIAVPGLPDRARVEEPASLGEVDLRAVGSEVTCHDTVDDPDREGDVAVPDEDDRGHGRLQRIAGGPLVDHVLPDRVAGAPVVELGALDLRLRREALEIRAVLVEQHGLRPARRDGRVRCEIVQVELAEDAEIVVADEADALPLADQRGHLVRSRPVADEVAQAPHLVRRIGVDRPEDRLERV